MICLFLSRFWRISRALPELSNSFTMKHLQFTDAVATARHAGRPLVALESTVISHGLPRPINLATARDLERIVTDAGATPATCAILQGQLCVGLEDEQLQHLAMAEGVRKVSRRDLPIAVAQRWDGATTVATTAWLAHRASIKVFATGGIGGVHRGALPDVSADLPELARLPMIVVCAGAKIVLDLPATREWLETHGVTVLGYQCHEMPAFYSRRSGLPVDARVETPTEIADIFKARQELGLDGAILVTQPVPEADEVPQELLENVLAQALRDADNQGISGRELTPFLLSAMSAASDGATLQANLALLANNAHLAARIAAAL